MTEIQAIDSQLAMRQVLDSLRRIRNIEVDISEVPHTSGNLEMPVALALAFLKTMSNRLCNNSFNITTTSATDTPYFRNPLINTLWKRSRDT